MEFLTALLKSMPGAVGQGLIWGIMAIGVYITYRILDVADLTVDGSLATGGAACVLLALNGVNIWIATLCAILAGMLAGLVTGLLHTRCGIPAILAGILTKRRRGFLRNRFLFSAWHIGIAPVCGGLKSIVYLLRIKKALPDSRQ